MKLRPAADAMHYVDLQVNGFEGIDFNADDLSTRDVVQACAKIRSTGVAGILATVITDDVTKMCRRIANIAGAIADDSSVAETVWGIHVEGPFLNAEPGYIGAHPPSHARQADPGAMNELLDAGAGYVKLVTLAPERDPNFEVTRALVERGVCVSAGHCNPTADELKGASGAGLSMFTHLGNGCPRLMDRHDNIIQRALSLAGDLWIGFIADGVHVPLPTLGNYMRAAGIDRCFVVTDAIAAAGCGPGTYEFAGQTVVVDENLATWAADRSHLTGSASTFPHLVENLRDGLGYTAQQIEALTSRNPRQATGMLT